MKNLSATFSSFLSFEVKAHNRKEKNKFETIERKVQVLNFLKFKFKKKMNKLTTSLLFILLLNNSFSQNFLGEVKKFEGQRIKKLVDFLNSIDKSTSNYTCRYYRDRRTLSRIIIYVHNLNRRERITIYFKPTKIKRNNPYCLCDIRIRMRRIIKIETYTTDLSD